MNWTWVFPFKILGQIKRIQKNLITSGIRTHARID